jgi:2-amino-4-hydroxy-6-hydroxymethyldihydropteridine diphosphokinase/dihydropteroate synthase
MKSIALGLGSNQGDRPGHLRLAIAELEQRGFANIRCSPVVESAAWLKPGAPAAWNLPFLNLVIEAQTELSANEALQICQQIEVKSGRGPHESWAPRTLDIDLLSWGEETITEIDLQIPHSGIAQRPFVLDPWVHLSGSKLIPGLAPSTLLQTRRQLPSARPILMAILNLTPDSFSDGGVFFDDDAKVPRRTSDRLAQLLKRPPAILDLGGQSTRPQAVVVSAEEEWRRLERALAFLQEFHQDRVRPWISIDTFRPEVARRALDWGVEMINDVSGLENPQMRELAAGSKKHFIFMHHLGVPVIPGQTLPVNCDPVGEVLRWAQARLELFAQAGISFDRLIFDPGIGFGKTPQQSRELIRRAAEFQVLPVRVLYGHSRKSYQQSIDPSPVADRDAITLIHSLHLARSGVEIIRIHDYEAHASALLAEEFNFAKGAAGEL